MAAFSNMTPFELVYSLVYNIYWVLWSIMDMLCYALWYLTFLYSVHNSVSSDEESPYIKDIPSDLSADDQLPLYASMPASPVPASAVVEIGSAALVVEVLRELDKDYMALRSRLVSLIEQQVSPTPVPVTSIAASASHSLQQEAEVDPESSRLMADNVNGLDQGSADSATVGMSGNESTDTEIENSKVKEIESGKKVTSRVKYWPSRQLVTVD